MRGSLPDSAGLAAHPTTSKEIATMGANKRKLMKNVTALAYRQKSKPSTPLLTRGALLTDYRCRWSSLPLEFTGQSSDQPRNRRDSAPGLNTRGLTLGGRIRRGEFSSLHPCMIRLMGSVDRSAGSSFASTRRAQRPSSCAFTSRQTVGWLKTQATSAKLSSNHEDGDGFTVKSSPLARFAANAQESDSPNLR